MIKGFVLDDERLKQGKHIFGKDYFNELIERIREIRAIRQIPTKCMNELPFWINSSLCPVTNSSG
ncbi:MAG: RhuM family protein [Methanobacteriota archaeon]